MSRSWEVEDLGSEADSLAPEPSLKRVASPHSLDQPTRPPFHQEKKVADVCG